RIQAEAEEAARIQAEAEEAARIQAEAEEAARIQAEAEEAARIQAEAEEAARIQAESPVVGRVSSDTDVEGVRGDISVNAAMLEATDIEHCGGYSRTVQRRMSKHRRASFAAHFVDKPLSGGAPRSVAPMALVVTESNQKGQFVAGFFFAILAVFAVCGVMLR
ncbi:kinetoplast-associated protein-like protein, partial [Leishmania panamensis]